MAASLKNGRRIVASSVRATLLALLAFVLLRGWSQVYGKPPLEFLTVADLAPDSVTMLSRFRPTTDRNGDTVAAFRWRFFVGRAPRRVEVLRGTVRLDTLQLEDGRVVLRWRVGTPYPGDTIYYSYSLRAVDKGGVPSSEVWSGYTRLIGEWGPPTPVVMPLDTIFGDVQPDSIMIVHVNAQPVGDTLRLSHPADTTLPRYSSEVQLCVAVLRGGVWFMARDQAADCYVLVSMPVWRNTL